MYHRHLSIQVLIILDPQLAGGRDNFEYAGIIAGVNTPALDLAKDASGITVSCLHQSHSGAITGVLQNTKHLPRRNHCCHIVSITHLNLYCLR